MDWESILRDQMWTFVGVIIAVAAIIISIVIYFFQKSTKGISYSVISETPLLTTKEQLEGKIKVLYNHQEVQDLTFLEIKLRNSGDIAIPASDYERPITLIFAPGAKILAAEIIKSEPQLLTTTLSVSQNSVSIVPVLMNSKDSMTIKAIISDSKGKGFVIDARIKDIREIVSYDNYSSFTQGVTSAIYDILKHSFTITK